MIKNLIILFLLIIISILMFLLKKNRKELVIKRMTDKDIDMIIHNLKEKLNKEKLKNTFCDKTITNYCNAINFFCSKDLNEYKKYIHLENNKNGEGIVTILYEDGIKHYDRVVIKCVVFQGKDRIEPLMELSVRKDDDSVTIGDINCNSHVGNGIGTCIMNTLTEVLPDYGVKKIKAPLSPTDYQVKEKLYNFYSGYNSFEIVKEIKRDEWGLAIKFI